MKNIQKTLENFGFSENETKVYLAMLKSGEASISKIASTAKLNRVTVHHIVARLEVRGLAVGFSKDNYKVVRGAHPAHLQKKLQEATSEFSDLIPELVASMRDSTGKVKLIVRMYHGIEGFELAAEELLERPNTIIRHIGSLAEAHKFIGVKYDLEHFVPTRVSKNIHYLTLQYKDEEKPILRTTNEDDMRKVRLLPKNYMVKSNTFMVPGKTVIVTTTDEVMTVVIESVDISESEIQKFDLLWDMLGAGAQLPH